MKIKEKGLTGKATTMRKDSISGRRGFNAFKEMADEKMGKNQMAKDVEKQKSEVWLEFMGTKIRVHKEGGGSINEGDVPFVQGATLKLTGCGGDANFAEMKVGNSFCLSGCLSHSA